LYQSVNNSTLCARIFEDGPNKLDAKRLVRFCLLCPLLKRARLIRCWRRWQFLASVGKFADSLSESHMPGSPLTKLGQSLPEGFGAVSIDTARSQEGKRLPNGEPSAAVVSLGDGVDVGARL
jgi:hypothetical protein